MYQTSYTQNPSVTFAGMLADSRNADVISRVNGTKQLDKLVFGTTDGTYTVSINGTQVASYVASSKTAAQIRDAVLALIQAATSAVVATSVSTDTIYLEGVDTTAFTTTISTVTSYALTHLLVAGQTIDFGLGVCIDERASTTASQCRLPRVVGDCAAGAFLGIAIADMSVEGPTKPATAVGYKNQSAVSILRHGGVIAVVGEKALAEGAALYCRYASGSGGSQLGAFTDGTDSSTAAAVAGLRVWRSSTAAGPVLAEFLP
jgi:hypothetical protein